MKDILIMGAGGHAREIAQLIDDINQERSQWNILGFIDIDKSNIGENNGKYQIVGDESFINNYRDISVAIALGSPFTVQKIVEKLLESLSANQFPNLVHPTVIPYMRDVKLDHGNSICAGNIITTNVIIGSFNCINRGCNISHDTIISDYCIINPGANISGGVNIKSGCLIGAGATILQYLTIGNISIVGAGAVVTKDVDDDTTVVGVSSKPIN